MIPGGREQRAQRESSSGEPALAGRSAATTVSGPSAGEWWQPDTRVALVVAIAIGAVVRGWHIWGAGFPLNDGGLFHAMVRDLQAAHYRLPAYTSYNGGQIPFGYSPLTLYLAGLLDDATGVGLLTLFRILPLAASTACIAALYPLARDMLPTRASVAMALVMFATVPRGFVWLLMGGGLTRSFGYLFALLALHRIWLLYTRRSLRQVPLATLYSALTALSHMGTAPFVAFSALLLLLFRGRHREGVVGTLLIGAGALILTAPWWATVVRMHGPGPFIAAQATGGSVLSQLAGGSGGAPDMIGMLARLALGTTGEGHFPLIWLLALIGMAWSIRQRRPLLPAWWATIILLDARAGFTYSSAPAAMLAGIGAASIVQALLAPRQGGRRPVPRPIVATALGALLVLSAIAAAGNRGFPGGETRELIALGPADRAAMRWVAVHTDSSARVLVLTSSPWQVDRLSEWFPVLAGRVSVATVQGTEWLPRGTFDASIRRQSRLVACASRGTACLDSLGADPALRFTHVYVPTGPTTACCRALLGALHRDPLFQVVHEDGAATILARR